MLGRRPDKIPVADSVEVSIIDDGDTIVSVLPVPKPKLSIVLIRKRDKLDVSGIVDARVALTAENDKGIRRPRL